MRQRHVRLNHSGQGDDVFPIVAKVVQIQQLVFGLPHQVLQLESGFVVGAFASGNVTGFFKPTAGGHTLVALVLQRFGKAVHVHIFPAHGGLNQFVQLG